MEQESELYGPPAFEQGAKVKAIRAVRNDGTYPGVPIGVYLIDEGEIGYVKAIGTYLNRFYVYTIEFVDRGILVGMRCHELECLESPR